MEEPKFMKVFFLFLSSSLVSFTFLFGQGYTTYRTADKKTVRLYDKARDALKERDLDTAIGLLEKTLEKEPVMVDAWLQLGNISFDLEQFSRAADHFKKALELYPEYQLSTWYRLALTQLQLNNYAGAVQSLDNYLNQEKISEINRQQALQVRANASFALEATQNPVPFDPKPLPASINTDVPEYLPALTADEAYLVYTSVINGQEDFYYSYKEGGEWQKGRPISNLNTPENEGAQSISADGRTLAFTACNRPDGLGSCDIYIATREGYSWSRAQNIDSPVNSAAWESQPCLNANGEVLLFAAKRKSGKGGADIYISHKKPDHTWTKPDPLPGAVNTPEDDMAPFLHPDGKSLYFMSKGHPGMGGFDLYLSRLDSTGNWGKPINLGYPINTTNNEGAITVSLDGRMAYFDSDQAGADRPDKTEYQADIYQFELYPGIRPTPATFVKGKVVEVGSKAPLVATVEVVPLNSERSPYQVPTSKAGDFLVVLPSGAEYAFNVSKQGYLFYSDYFDLQDARKLTDPYQLEIQLTKVEDQTEGDKPESTPIVLKNVFFSTGSADLQPKSRTELLRLKDFLENHPDLSIQINGHTDNIGTPADNQALSEARAEAVRNFLVASGIAADRLRFKGFGETRPLAGNDTEAGRSQNRRTEFQIIP